MEKYKIIFNGEEQDEVYDTYNAASNAANDMVAEYHEGGEIFELSNPGDYPYDPTVKPEYEIVEE